MDARLPIRLLMVLAACLAGGAALAEPDAVTLQLNGKHRFQFAGYYAAVEKGYYREAGLAVTLREANGERDPVAALIDDDADFAISSSNVVLHRARGDPVVALAVIFQHSPLELLALKDRGVTTLAGLDGKRIMMHEYDSELLAALARQGIPRQRIKVVPPSYSVQELLAGKVDAMSAYATDEPFTLQRRGQAAVELAPSAADMDFYGDTLVTGEAQLRVHPARVRAFRDASLRGWQYAMAHTGEIAELIQARYSQRRDSAQLVFEAEQMRRLMQPQLVDIGQMNTARWQHIADIYTELGMLPKGSSIEGLVYREVDDRARQEWLVRSLIGTLLVLALLLPFTWRMRRLNRQLQEEIAERHQTEALLRASDERMRKLLDISPDGIVTTDPHGRISYCSRKLGDILTAPKTANLLGQSIFEWIHPEDRDTMRSRVQRLLHGEELPPRAYRLIKYDGSSTWGEVASAVIHDPGGGIEGLLIIVRDINERKFLEEALHRTNESLLAQIEETTRLQDQLREQAIRDPLTGLYNRRYLDETLDREIARAERERYPLCVAIVDLDHFKEVNDTYGHQSGDEVLKTIGRLLRGSARSGDIACRWGGEEFMLVLPRMTEETAAQRTDQWRIAFSELVFSFAEPGTRLTLSVGIASFPVHGRTAGDLTQHADMALYLAKAQGRNRVVVFTPA